MRHVIFEAYSPHWPKRPQRIAAMPDELTVLEAVEGQIGYPATLICIRKVGDYCVEESFHRVMEKIQEARG